MAISRASALGRLGPAQQAEGDVLPDGEAVKKCAALKEHSEAGKEGIAVAFLHIVAINCDLTAVGRHEAKDGFEHHRFACARAADDHHGGALFDGQVDALQDML